MKNKLKILDLFSGIGGFSLGLERTGYYETVAFCEIDKYCKLLLQKHWKGVKIYNDVKEITQEGLKADGIESPDIITGGFPCQPFSVAGKQKGTSDNRHLWPEMFRIIKAFKPRFVIGENVRGIINIQDGVVFETVCTDLESEGYEVQPFIIPAAGVGAPHRRERVWIIAIREESMVNSDNIRFEQHNTAEEEASRRRSSATFEPTSDVANTNESNSRERKVSRDIDNEGRRASETRGESLQSEDRQTRTDNLGSGSEDVENARRTLRQGTELRKENEDEIERKDANQYQRSSRSSESDVADTNINGEKWNQPEDRQRSRTQQSGEDVADSESFSSDVGERGEYQEERDGQRKIRGEGSEDVADTQSKSSNNFTNSRGNIEIKKERSKTGSTDGGGGREDASNTDRTRLQRLGSEHELRNSEEEKQTRRIGWWDVEPDVGRVAHGVSGRVHRLRALGNSIIPQIAEEIGKAIINMERRKNEERH